MIISLVGQGEVVYDPEVDAALLRPDASTSALSDKTVIPIDLSNGEPIDGCFIDTDELGGLAFIEIHDVSQQYGLHTLALLGIAKCVVSE